MEKTLILFGILFVGAFLLLGCTETGSTEETTQTTHQTQTQTQTPEPAQQPQTHQEPEAEPEPQLSIEEQLLGTCNKYEACMKISTSEKQEDCFYIAGTVSAPDRQKGCCFGVSNLSRRDECILKALTGSIYLLGERRDLCQYLTTVNQSTIDNCYEEYAKLLGSEWCDKIQNVSLRDECYIRWG